MDGEQLALGQTAEDRQLGLRLGWDLTRAVAERIRAWARAVELPKATSSIDVTPLRNGQLEFRVTGHRKTGPGTRFYNIGVMRCAQDDDFVECWLHRKIQVGAGVPASIEARVKMWAKKRWADKREIVLEKTGASCRLQVLPTIRCRGMDVGIGLDDDPAILWRRSRALDRLGG